MAAFESFQDEMLRQGALLATLQTNYRSHEGLLSPVNGTFSRLMKEEKYVQPPYISLEPSPGQEKKEGWHFAQIQNPSEGSLKAEEAKRKEGEVIAKWIKKHVGKDLGGVPLEYRHCCLLFRSGNHFEPYLDALKEAGIPYLAEGEKFFYQTLEVTEFLNLVSAVANPDDKLALVGVLRSPVGGLTDDEILRLKLKESLDYRKSLPLLKDKLEPLFKTLRRLSEMRDFLPVSQVIQEIFRQTWVLEFVLHSRYGEQALANILKIQSLADRWSENNPLTLNEFVRRFKEYREDEKEEGENPLADMKVDAVKLMTIHKAKGLEFPVVFLPNLFSPKGGANNRPLLLRDWKSGKIGLRLPRTKKVNGAMILLEEAFRKKEEAEELRVFYVAVTRAKTQVHCLLREGKVPAGSLAQFLQKAGFWPTKEGPVLDFGGETVPFDRIPWGEKPTLQDFSLSKEKLGAGWNPKILAALQLKRKKEEQRIHESLLIESPTHLMQSTSKTQESQENEKWRVLEDNEPVFDSSSVKLGLVCHKILEDWDFSVKGQQQQAALSNLLAKSARLFELPPSDTPSGLILEEAKKILLTFFKSGVYKEISKGKILARELPFLYPLKQTHSHDSELMRGVIDLLYEKNGNLVIADYKTTKLKGLSPKSAAEPYRIQGDQYKKAIKNVLKKGAQFEIIFLREGQSVLI